MSRSHSVRALLANVATLIALALVGTGQAQALTPLPSPTPTPTPTPMLTPTPTPKPPTFCATPVPFPTPRQLSAVTSTDGTRVDLAWDLPTGPPGIGICYPQWMSWTVLLDGMPVGVASRQSYTLTGLRPNTTYQIDVRPIDDAVGGGSRVITTNPPVCVDAPHGEPTNYQPLVAPPTTVFDDSGDALTTIRWTRPYGCGVPIARYRVDIAERGNSSATIVQETEQPASDPTETTVRLVPGRNYVMRVVTIDEQGGFGWSNTVLFTATPEPIVTPTPTPEPVITPTPTPEPVVTPTPIPALPVLTRAGVSGTTVLRTLTPAALSLNGTTEYAVTPEGTLTGSRTTLAPGTLTIRVAGLFLTRARATFSEVGATTGSNEAGTLRLSTAQNITFSGAKVFGIDLLLGRTCRTAAPAVITTSATTPPFLSGPTRFTGALTMPRTTGCGFFGTLLTPTGGTNTTVLTLTP